MKSTGCNGLQSPVYQTVVGLKGPVGPLNRWTAVLPGWRGRTQPLSGSNSSAFFGVRDVVRGYCRCLLSALSDTDKLDDVSRETAVCGCQLLLLVLLLTLLIVFIQQPPSINTATILVHGQVTIISVVSVCLFVSLFVCAEFFSAVFDPISIKLGHVLYVLV